MGPFPWRVWRAIIRRRGFSHLPDAALRRCALGLHPVCGDGLWLRDGGDIWIGSRASISAIVNAPQYAGLGNLVALYDLRYESLLNVARVAILLVSVIFVWLTATGRSAYPRWVAFFNPIILLLFSFAVGQVVPAIGIYMMPIALNIGFAIFFCLSRLVLLRSSGQMKTENDEHSRVNFGAK